MKQFIKSYFITLMIGIIILLIISYSAPAFGDEEWEGAIYLIQSHTTDTTDTDIIDPNVILNPDIYDGYSTSILNPDIYDGYSTSILNPDIYIQPNE